MTNSITLNSVTWSRVTLPGESGVCWKKTGDTVIIDHTDQEGGDTLPLSNINVTVDTSKRVPLDTDSNEMLIVSADNPNDVYYALIINSDQPGKITIDTV